MNVHMPTNDDICAKGLTISDLFALCAYSICRFIYTLNQPNWYTTQCALVFAKLLLKQPQKMKRPTRKDNDVTPTADLFTATVRWSP